MIKELKLSNFRLFDNEVKVRFRPITVLIGRNNAGKSSIIKFLLMLQQSLQTSGRFLNPQGERVNMGSFWGLKNSNSKKDSLDFQIIIESSRVSSQIEKIIEMYRPLTHKKQNKYMGELRNTSAHQETEAQSEKKAIFQFTCSVPYKYGRNGNQKIQANSASGLQIKKEEHIKRVGGDSLMDFGGIGKILKEEGSLGKVFDEKLKTADMTDALLQTRIMSEQHLNYIREMYEGLYLESMKDEILDLQHIQPTRKSFRGVVEITPPPKNSVDQDGKFSMSHLGEIQKEGGEEAQILFDYLELVTDITNLKFLRRKVFEDESDELIKTVIATNKKTKARSRLSEFGFGVSQAIPVLVQGVISKPNTQMMVEQPEAQLHPTAQLELGSFFADIWKKRKVGSIIETHSDNILLRLRRLIAKGELSAEDVSVAFFDIKGGKPTIKNIDIKEDGSMDPGLPMEFFHASIRDALKMGAGK